MIERQFEARGKEWIISRPIHGLAMGFGYSPDARPDRFHVNFREAGEPKGGERWGSISSSDVFAVSESELALALDRSIDPDSDSSEPLDPRW